MAKRKKISVIKLMEDFSTAALSQFDAQMKFRSLAKGGCANVGLKVLDKLDKAFFLKGKNRK